MTDSTTPLAGCAPAFGRPGAYPPRHGWLLKVHTALQADPLALQRPDVTVLLGVGSSMVPSMKFWARAFRLVDQDPADGALRPTARGRWLLNEDGADPYLETPASLWLLHWWLLSARPCLVPTWYYVFAYAGWYHGSRAELHRRVRRAAEATGWMPPADSTLTRDIGCLVTMYAPSAGSEDRPRSSWEDVLTHPFRDLQLISTSAPSADSRDRTQELSVHRGGARVVPDAILAYACLSWADQTNGPQPGSISVSRLATDTGAPGRVLLVEGRRLHTALQRAAERIPQLAVVESATGEALLAYSAAPGLLADRLLAAAYRRTEGPDGLR